MNPGPPNARILKALQDPKKTVEEIFPVDTEFWIPNTVLAYWGGEVEQVG
jgi:hypothetical protein